MKRKLQQLKKEISSRFVFLDPCTSVIGNDRYFCSCGQVLEKEPDTEFEVEMSYEDYLNIDVLDISKLTKRTKLVCHKCNSDFSKQENYSRIRNLNQKFIEKFLLEENSKFILLHKIKFWATEDIRQKIKVESSSITIGISKKEKKSKVYFFDEGQNTFNKIDLGEIVKTVDRFFQKDDELEVTEDFIHVHSFIGRIGSFVSDVENIDIVNELLSEIKFNAGIEVLKKIISSFLGIICYSNLSTIAMTKGPKFLFDLMQNCPLPSIEYMEKSGATSPLKIFNYLVNLKNKQIQNELDSDDLNKIGYRFINEQGREFLIKYDSKRFDENSGKVAKVSNNLFVRDQVIERQISPFIFNKISKFSDYENLMKYLRFITYEQLISLCRKHDKEFLIQSYKLFEFRFDVDYDRILQFLGLIEDFCRTVDFNKEGELNFSSIAKYDLNIYDDCQRMLTELDWDFNKVFYKIKKHSKLLGFHDNLVKHRSYLNDLEVNQKYVDFSNKFKYLEEYVGNISVKLIQTPEKLVEKANLMKNCAASYVRRVAMGEYITFNVYDKNPQRKQEDFYEYMMVLEMGKYGLEFVGVKGPCNIYGPDRFKIDVRHFLEKSDISYKEVPSIRLGIENK